jgi:hypothetical protein
MHDPATHAMSKPAQGANAVRRQQQGESLCSPELWVSRQVKHGGERAYSIQFAEAASIHQMHPGLGADHVADMLSQELWS